MTRAPSKPLAKLSGRHARTLKLVFTDPVQASIAWKDIEALLVAAGCKMIEGDGSRVRFQNGGMVASFHRPHPAKEAKRYQVRDAREFLSRIGWRP